MPNHTIHPIPLGEMTLDKSLYTSRMDFGKKLDLGIYAWYIEGPTEKILVDSGLSVEYFLQRGIPSRRIQPLESALNKLGLDVADIDLVIQTHLHHEHIAEAHKLPKARFLVQRKELEFAMNPHPAMAGVYAKKFIEGVNFETIDGDEQVCDGVDLLLTPGHTVGSQSVAIKTAQGTAVISGLCTIQQNFEPPESVKKSMRVIPIGICVNLLDAYDSLCRIKDVADIIIANHDPVYENISHIP
jgi:N-acyl homoserine lactone hydrolase